MVQLQKDIKKIEATGTQVIAVSYDPVKSLSAFADKQNITFALLSDPKSQCIKAYGVLNKKAPAFIKGVPYPGTFLIDNKGVIRAKLFKEGYRTRHTTAALLQAIKALKKP